MPRILPLCPSSSFSIFSAERTRTEHAQRRERPLLHPRSEGACQPCPGLAKGRLAFAVHVHVSPSVGHLLLQ